jgi:tetratricopeptide (TPR) repeat protein
MVEKIGPYRVYERLGVGGMGEVFKAFDDRLDRWVAIKRIRPDREDAEDNRERFKREARATARLNHPSIVHLYGIFQDGDSDCIVMEYVEGRGLDTILADGPLDPLRVATLGHEIASGLAEAHSNGILHRDLKAENIIITPKGRAKILDFGLAKPILRSELDPVLTGKGQLVGTSRAMSPEYVSGDEVDHRSDLFALGVLLYECLTGQSPFKAHNTLATLKQVMLHRQLPAKQLNSRVPADLSDLIDRLLEKDPADRPQSAQEVAGAFGRLTGQLSSGPVEPPSSGTQPIFQPTTTQVSTFSASDTVLDLRPRNRWMTVVAVLALLLIGAFFLGRYLQTRDRGRIKLPPGEQIKLVLGDFANLTGQEKFDASVAQAFRTSLEPSEALNVLSPAQMRDALTRMQRPPESRIDQGLGAELAQREGADRLVMGSISSIGTNYTLVAEVVNPATLQVEFTAREKADDENQIMGAIEKAASELRSYLGESSADIERTARPLEKVTTPNFEALKAYTLGTEKAILSKRDESIAYLNKAIALDANFAMAHAKLVVIYSNQGKREEALRHIKGALDNSDRLSAVEQFYVNGWVARWEGTPDQVIENWQQMSELHPKEHAAHWNLGVSLLTYRRDFEGAAAAARLAVDTAPGTVEEKTSYNLLGDCLLALGRNDEAFAAFDKAAEFGLDSQLSALLAMRQYDEVAKRLPAASASTQNKLRALLQLDQGNLEEAIAQLAPLQRTTLAAGTELTRIYELTTDLATLRWLAGERSETVALIDEGMAFAMDHLDIQGLRTDVSPVTMLLVFGQISARLGDLPRATRILDVVSAQAKKYRLELWAREERALRAEILLAEGKRKDAAEMLDGLPRTSLAVRESAAHAAASAAELALAAERYRQLAEERTLAFIETKYTGVGLYRDVANSTLAHFHLGLILAQQGQSAPAKESFQRFLALWPRLAPGDRRLVAASSLGS